MTTYIDNILSQNKKGDEVRNLFSALLKFGASEVNLFKA
jgi:hypothetical protein